MNFFQLRYFVEAVKCGSFNKAAKNLFVNPATLTVAINNLEEELGYAVLNRTHKGVTVTEEGEQLFDDAMTILAIEERWASKKNFSYLNTIDCHIEMIPAIYNSVFPDIAYKYASQDANVNLVYSERYMTEIERNFIKHQDFIAISYCCEGEEERIFSLAKNLGIQCEFIHSCYWKPMISSKNPLASQSELTLQQLKQMQGCATSFPLYNHRHMSVYDFSNTLFLYRQNAFFTCRC